MTSSSSSSIVSSGGGIGRNLAYDAVVVGAGPAGLSAAVALTSAGLRCLVIDQGRSHVVRDHDAPDEILSGVGGAGLFSDGKHSFYPAATDLWRLPDRSALFRAYRETQRLLMRHHVDAPPFPLLNTTTAEEEREDEESWSLKKYPSIYASLEERKRCIAELYEECGELPWLRARVIEARRISNGLIALLIDRESEIGEERQTRVVEARNVIVATGRLSPRWTRSWLESLGVRFEFRRLEIGVRLETNAEAPLFRESELSGVDPKLRTTTTTGSSKIHFLTFCTCRNGEVVRGTSCNLHAISGRADGPRGGKTGLSSIGLLARITDEALSREIEPFVFKENRSESDLLGLPLTLASADHPAMIDTFGERGAAVVANAIDRFVEHFGEALKNDPAAMIHGPCIEGVGDYPVSDDNLALAPNVYIAGDACGRFRGIVSSMVSGRYVGTRIAEATTARAFDASSSSDPSLVTTSSQSDESSSSVSV